MNSTPAEPAATDPVATADAYPSAERLAALGVDRGTFLAQGLSRAEAAAVGRDWNLFMHDAQRAPKGDWITWLLLGGRGSGKTRAGAEWVRQLARDGVSPIALVGASMIEARQVMIEGPSGILTVSADDERPKLVGQRLRWPNGVEGLILGAQDPERFRGPQFAAAWCDELGCGAVDKGANQPNAFPDQKSSEGTRPYFSSGTPDALAQRQFLRAHLDHWSSAANPVSSVYGGPMVDPAHIALWSWDARPFPAFPGDAASWSDAENHQTGHWLTGRLGGAASDELLAALCAEYEAPLAGADAIGPLLDGLALDRIAPARDAMAGVLGVTGLVPGDSPAGLVFGAAAAQEAVLIDVEALVDEPPRLSRRRSDPAEAPARLTLGYAARAEGYLSATATALRPGAGGTVNETTGLVLEPAGARLAAERLLLAAGAGDTLELSLPPSRLALEPGDVLDLPGEGGGPFVITEIRDGLTRRLQLAALPVPGPVTTTGAPPRLVAAPAPVAAPLLLAIGLPPDPATPDRGRLALAAHAKPWPGSVDITVEATGTRLARLSRAAAMGELATPLHPGPIHLWDTQSVEIELYAGHLADLDPLTALAGGNGMLVETDAGGWEWLSAANAELIAPGRYRLKNLLRGLNGTDPAMGPASAGNRLLLLDDAVALVAAAPEWLGGSVDLRAYAGRTDAVGSRFAADLPVDLLLPLPPAHLHCRRLADGTLAFGWSRRSRADTGSWAVAEVPLEHAPEAYRLEILEDGDLVRQFDINAPGVSYALAEQLADFGAPATGFTWRVAQQSLVFGPGHVAEAICHA